MSVGQGCKIGDLPYDAVHFCFCYRDPIVIVLRPRMSHKRRSVRKRCAIAAIALLAVPVLSSCCVRLHTAVSMNAEERTLADSEVAAQFSEIRNTGRPPAVLLIHGFGGSPFDLKPVADALAQRGCALRAIVLPGHGSSPRDLRGVKKSAWLKAAQEAYEELKEEYGEVSIIGFSMGGAIALCLAAENPVERLVLVSPYFQVSPRWYCPGRPETWAARLSGIIPFVKKPKIGQINDPKGLESYMAYRHLPTDAVAELAAVGSSARDQAKHVRCDTLWIHSSGDVVADFTVSKEVFESLPAARKRFVEYRRSNHVILYDFDRESTVHEVVSFVTDDADE